MLAGLLDAMRIRQYFNAITMTREVVGGIRDDAGFLIALRRAILPLPFERARRVNRAPFPPLRPHPLEHFGGRRVAMLATGGSGALASVVGAARAFEEAGIHPSCISLCSGSALFGFPLAAGRAPDEVASFTLGLGPSELVDLNWPGLLALGPRLGRGFTGFLRGQRIEDAYLRWLGGITLGEMPIPAYAPVWNVEQNTVEFVGPRTHPDMTVARAVRMAVALPLFIEAVELNGQHYYDGGTADILPVHPLLDIEDPPDAVLVINGFYPADFTGDDMTGWVQRAGSIFHAAAQVRSVQHLQLARENLARLRREVAEVMMIQPVPYASIRGYGLYREFIDNSRWPDFMRSGRAETRRVLEEASGDSVRRTPPAHVRAESGAGSAGQRIGQPLGGMPGDPVHVLADPRPRNRVPIERWDKLPVVMRAFALADFESAAHLMELPTPGVDAGHVLVGVRAATVNGFDVAVASGMVKDMMEHRLPVIIGRDFAGVVEQAGEGVVDLKAGDEVTGLISPAPYLHEGTFADYVAVPIAPYLVSKPDKLDFMETGGLGLAAATAQACVDAVAPVAGDVVLIVGAGGGVGGYATQLAAASGATVVATHQPGDEERIRGLGAADVIDYTKGTEAALASRYPGGIDCVIDVFDRDPAAFDALVGHVNEGGRAASTMGVVDAEKLSKRGITGINVNGQGDPATFHRAIAAAGRGELKPVIERVYPLEQAADALAVVASSKARGKQVVSLSG